jgi:hypothetical protein
MKTQNLMQVLIILFFSLQCVKEEIMGLGFAADSGLLGCDALLLG